MTDVFMGGPLAWTTGYPYIPTTHASLETNAFLSAAGAAGMTEEERDALKLFLGESPEAGDIMPGCGGARKLRFRKPGTGKSGGYRVIYYVAGEEFPIFLLTVFGKNEKANLTMAERNGIAKLVKMLRDSYGERT